MHSAPPLQTGLSERELELLTAGELELEGIIPWGSNYTFLAWVKDAELSTRVIYKPCAGEQPLWDFGRESLCRREVAAYLVSRQLGWPSVPPTVLRDGPYGLGSAQLFIHGDHTTHYFNLRERGEFSRAFRRIALFDCAINNADRKGGHCLLGPDGRVWAIDHGLTFHHELKLRTVIWDYAGERVPAGCLADLRRLRGRLGLGQALREDLSKLITAQEIRALQERLTVLMDIGLFPHPGPGRNTPYPLV